VTDLRVWRGDTVEIAVAAVKADGSPLPLAGYTLRFSAKERLSDDDTDAVISKMSPDNGIAIDDEPGGLATVTLAASDTEAFAGPRTLVWDIQMAAATGEVKTLDSGRLYVAPDVTRATV